MGQSNKVIDLTVRLNGNTASYDRNVTKSKQVNERFTKSVRGINSGLTAVDGPLNGIAGRFSALTPIVSGSAGALATVGAAFAASSLLTINAMKRLSDYEVQQLKIQQMLKATGYAAGISADELAAQADAVALATLASVEEIQQAQGVLLSFKAVQGETFKEAIRLSQDMAAVFGGTAKDKALQLGKALESPTDGLNALKRSGVSFTEEQKRMIRRMDETGNRAEAQRMILENLQNQIGGSGAAQAGGLAGAVDTLGQRWDEALKAFAKSTDANTAAQTFLSTLATGLERVTNALNGPTDRERFAELAQERAELQADLEKLGNGERTGFLSYIIGTDSEWYNVQRRLTAVRKEMQGLQDKFKTDTIEQAEQDATSAETQEGLKEKPDFFGYSDKQIEASLERMKTAFATKEERERIAAENRQNMLDAAMFNSQITEERWQELSAQNWENYQGRVTEIQRRESEKRADTEKKQADALKKTQQENVTNLNNFSNQTLQALEQSGKKRSALYKAMFASQKLAAIPSMINDTEKASVSAMALLPGPAGIALGGVIKGIGYASVGIVAGQTIAGAYEQGGIIPGNSYTGDNLMAMVNSREMVLNVGQQKQLFDIANGKGGTSGAGVVVNVIEDASRAGTQSRDVNDQGQEVIAIWVANVRAGGEAAQVMESTYQMERVGT